MKKIASILSAIILLGAMTFALTACGNNDTAQTMQEVNETPEAMQEDTTTQAPTPELEPEPEP
jgi:uncharacterized protein YxeA